MTTQLALIEAPQKLSPTHGHLMWSFMRHTNDLPKPTTAEVSVRDDRLHVSLTMVRGSDVDAWAEALNVDVDHENHGDGVWSDIAEGHLDVHGTEIAVEVRYETNDPYHWLAHRPYCDHCNDHGCRACDPDSTATPRAWLA